MYVSQVGLLAIPQSRVLIALDTLYYFTSAWNALHGFYTSPFNIITQHYELPALPFPNDHVQLLCQNSDFFPCQFISWYQMSQVTGDSYTLYSLSSMRPLLYLQVENSPLWESTSLGLKNLNFQNRDYKFIKWVTGSDDERQLLFLHVYFLSPWTHAFIH